MKARSTDNIAGHQFRWLRAIRDAIALEQISKNKSKAARKRLREETRRATGKEPARKTVAKLTPLDLMIAVDLTAFMAGGLQCFRSSLDAAEACGCDETTADASFRRLIAAGYLEKLPPEPGERRRKGRPASRYRVPYEIPVAQRENSDPNLPKRDGENGEVSPLRDGMLSPSPDRTNRRDDQMGAKAPSAPMPPITGSSISDVESENGRYGADNCANRPFSQEPDSGPKEEDETIIVPPDDPRPLPELPASLEEEWRRADEQAEPPEPRAPEDDPDALAEIENLTFGNIDPVEFITEWERGFIACDADSAGKVLAIVARSARQTAKTFPSYRDAVKEFLIDPLIQHLATIAEGGGYDPDTVATAVQDFRDAFDVASGKTEQDRRVTYG